MSSDLTGSHLDAATGRDDETAAGDGKAGDDSDDDDDDDDETGAGARAARQATRTVGGAEARAADKGDEGAGEGGAAASTASGGGGGGEDAAAKEAGLDGEVKEMERNKLVRTFFRGLLKEWEMDLNVRPDHVKRTVQGKLETKTQKQAKDYMRPLFKLCKQKVGVVHRVRCGSWVFGFVCFVSFFAVLGIVAFGLGVHVKASVFSCFPCNFRVWRALC